MTIGWDAAFVIVTVLLAWSGLLVAVIGWLVNRMFDGMREEMSELKVANQAREREHMELRASLPLNYVQREDWIRFSVGLDAKLDTIRAEMRERRKPANGND